MTATDDVEALRGRLAEAHEALDAIRQGDVDALIVRVGDRDQVYTRVTPDEPYRDLVEQMQEGAVVLSVTGDILYCNTRFAKLVGTSLEAVIGTRFSRFVHASGSEGLQALLRSRTGRYRCQLIGPEAETVEAYVSLTTTVSKGVDRLNLIVTDLRELLEAHSSRDRAEQDSRMKDGFLATLAHELRNPLGAINTGVRLLASTKSSGDTETRARDVIARQVGRLSHLVNDLLDMERVISGQIQLNRRPFDMAEALRRAVSIVSDVGLDRQIDVSVEPVWVDGDAVRIEQVLTSLLTNAVDHTPPGGRIQVGLRGDGHDAVVTMEDAGVGISPGLLPFIFDMFVQGEQNLDRAKGGLGIGLTLVHRLVTLHGGTVAASSEGEGHGSTFTVRLRQVPAADRPTGCSARPNRADPRRVLLIEDDRDAREMIRLMLELAGHAVYNAADGLRGLELLKVEDPDVAIIDVGLPGLDGYQVARRIREHLNGRAMLLLALTGYGSARDHQHSTEAGFDYHLVKPVDLDTLACLLQTGAPPVEAA